MSDLEDALRLALRARDSWRTLQGTVVTWTHFARSAEAHRRVSESRGGSQAVLYATGVPEAEAEPPAEQEQRTSLWVALPDRARSETRSPGAPGGGEWEMTVVVHGDTFWMHHPATGATTNNGDGSYQAGLGVEPSLLDPAPMVLGSAVRIAGETTVAGRTGVVLHLEPRPASLLAVEPDYANFTRSPVELVLDADRGTGLSLTLLIDGDPFQRAAFTEIAFDEPIPEERLTFAPPASGEIPPAGAR